MLKESYLWEAAEVLAIHKYYINDTEKPALLVIWHKGKYHLQVNKVGLIGAYKSEKQLKDRIIELIKTANYPIKLYRWKHGKRDKKPFTENDNYSERYLNAKEDCPIRAFEIPEWSQDSKELRRSG